MTERERRIALVMCLDAARAVGTRIRVQAFAELFCVAYRTVQRDLKHIRTEWQIHTAGGPGRTGGIATARPVVWQTLSPFESARAALLVRLDTGLPDFTAITSVIRGA